MSGFEVPDGIEPVEGWRFWRFDNTGLKSVNDSVPWLPGEKVTARCTANRSMWYGTMTSYRWEIVEGGISREKAEELAGDGIMGVPRPPATVLPPGLGYEIASNVPSPSHESPDVNCSCGLYAGKELADCPGGDVFGKVKMWGKVIPGERGWRAQYAYPSELYASAKILSHPALLAYGVPVIGTGVEHPAERQHGPNWARRSMWGAAALNLGAMAFNLTMASLR